MKIKHYIRKDTGKEKTHRMFCRTEGGKDYSMYIVSDSALNIFLETNQKINSKTKFKLEDIKKIISIVRNKTINSLSLEQIFKIKREEETFLDSYSQLILSFIREIKDNELLDDDLDMYLNV